MQLFKGKSLQVSRDTMRVGSRPVAMAVKFSLQTMFLVLLSMPLMGIASASTLSDLLQDASNNQTEFVVRGSMASGCTRTLANVKTTLTIDESGGAGSGQYSINGDLLVGDGHAGEINQSFAYSNSPKGKPRLNFNIETLLDNAFNGGQYEVTPMSRPASKLNLGDAAPKKLNKNIVVVPVAMCARRQQVWSSCG